MVVVVTLSKQLLVSRRTTAAQRMKRRGGKRRMGMKEVTTHGVGKVQSRGEDEMEGMGSDVEGWG